MTIFWVVALCSLVEVYQYPDDGGSKHLWNINFYQTTRRNNREDSHLHTRHCENLKTHSFFSCSRNYQLWNLKVHDHHHRTTPVDSNLKHLNSVHNFTTYFFKTRLNTVFPSTPWSPTCSLPLLILNHNHFLFPPMYATYPTHC
jgi:hypothetical protein